MITSRLKYCVRPLVYSRGLPLRPLQIQIRNASGAELPAPPPIPQSPGGISDVASVVGEPTFRSMGLGGWSPSGIAQSSFEFLHVDVGLPWWGAIVAGTVCVRALLLPLFIMSQRNSANMNNHMPAISALQKEITDARQSGDRIGSARASHKLQTMMKANNLSPIKNALVPIAQFPIFLSIFIGLRGMANRPVESMTSGGLFWFTDLTMADQYYALPVLVSATMWLTIEISMKGLGGNKTGALATYVVRALPVIMLPFTMNFATAILCYWLSTNLMSLSQTSALKIPALRRFLKIPMLNRKPETSQPENKKGFIKSLKSSWSEMKNSRKVDGMMKTDEMQFNKAGRGPLVKTYSYDPTRTVQAKTNR